MARLTLHQRIKDAIKVKLLGRNFGDLFITDGDGVYHNAIDRGLPEGKLVLNHLGVDVARFSRNTEARQSLRESLGASGEQMIYLALGWSPVIKGTDLFLKAAEGMNQDGTSDSLFLVVGTSETREFVSSFPESTRLGPRLRILDRTDDFPRLLNGVDVFVAPSRSEGFAYAVMEAMAAGKLILCSDIPGVRDAYGRLEGVWLFPSEDWKKLAELMQRAKELPNAEREHLGRANSRYVAEHLSLEVWAKKISEIYGSLLNM
jgi:glycosyltransferase involved in cell wall biosynthesis